MSDENIIDWLRSTSGLGLSHPALGGYTWRHREAADDLERLTDELADALKNESHYAKEIIKKDKRIESLEQALAKASLRTQELEQDRERGLEERGYHIITTDQVEE